MHKKRVRERLFLGRAFSYDTAREMYFPPSGGRGPVGVEGGMAASTLFIPQQLRACIEPGCYSSSRNTRDFRRGIRTQKVKLASSWVQSRDEE